VIDALETAERAVAAAEADEAEAVVLAERSGFARFAASEVHQPTLVEDATVSLRVVRDGKVGIAATNDLADEGLRRLARRATESAESAPAEESFPGLADPAPLPAVGGYDEDTATLGPDDQARLAAAVFKAANLALVRCAECDATRSRVEGGEWVVSRGVTTREQTRDVAKKYGARTFLDVALTMREEPEVAQAALRAGALAFVVKHAADNELIHAIRRAAAGETYLNRNLAGRLAAKRMLKGSWD